MSGNGKKGKVLVIGGGISGISAALEASEAGAEAVLVEKTPYLGGRVAQMNLYFPKLCPPTCGLEINLRRLRTSPRVRCLTLATVEKLSGGPGAYKAVVKQEPRYVNNRCTACNACVEVCPAERPDAFNFGMNTSKAVYTRGQAAHPALYTIDRAACPAGCTKCVEACTYKAIDLEMKPQTHEIEAGAVVCATGWEPYDAKKLENLGFGACKNVVTNMMLERLATRDGPTEGKILRPSDGKAPEKVAFVQCAGSRDENHLAHCSGVCCMGSLKQARYVREQYPEAQIFVFYIDLRTPGRLEDFLAETQKDPKVTLIKGKVAKITEDGSSGDVVLEAEDTLSGSIVKEKVNLAILATGLVPAEKPAGDVEGGLEKDEFGFLKKIQSKPGLVGAGCAKRPVDVASCVRDATAAALKALQHCGD